jgi:uncharacterized protein
LADKCIYLDANVYIELWENKTSPHGRLLWDLLVRGSQRGWRFVSSELTLAEVLVKPISIAKASGNWSLADTYRFQIYDKGQFQHIAPVSRDILDMAANVRSENASIRLPDAIHLATALLNECTIFISNDTSLVSAIKSALVPKRIDAAFCFSELAEAELLR